SGVLAATARTSPLIPLISTVWPGVSRPRHWKSDCAAADDKQPNSANPAIAVVLEKPPMRPPSVVALDESRRRTVAGGSTPQPSHLGHFALKVECLRPMSEYNPQQLDEKWQQEW